MDKKASDVTVLEMHELTSYTDYFVICSGESGPQVQAIAENIDHGMKAQKIKPMGIEGKRSGNWILLDFGDVVVHVFEAETREYYSLERLWLDAPRVEVHEDKAPLGR